VVTLKAAREMFDRADKSGDGRVNKRELIIALRKDPELCEMLGLQSHIHQVCSLRNMLFYLHAMLHDVLHDVLHAMLHTTCG
jgi:hypothetical protein